MKLSSLSDSIHPSGTLSLTARAAEMRAKGLNVISMSSGELDLEPPAVVINAANDAMQSGKIRYTAAAGMPKLRAAVAEKYAKSYSIDLSPKNVIITAGAKHALANSFLALLEPNDEVIIPIPYWVSYPEMVTIAGGKSVIAKTSPDNNFKLTSEILIKSMSKRTRAVLLNSPSNPSGTVYSSNEIEAIMDVIKGTDVVMVSDEIYESIVLDGQHASILDFGMDIFNNAVFMSGVSKAYAMTGWRLGWAIGDEKLIETMARIQAHQTSNACTISQYATLAALENADDFVAGIAPLIRKRRDAAMELLKRLPQFKPIYPAGAFYIYCDVRELLGEKFVSSQALVEYLLTEALVATVPGEAFGTPGFIRMSIAIDEETIAKAINRIVEALSKV